MEIMSKLSISDISLSSSLRILSWFSNEYVKRFNSKKNGNLCWKYNELDEIFK
jgi:hypothetical protein